MTAKIAGFVSRKAAGLRAPKSVSKNIAPSNGGVAFHYGGPAQKLTSHASCVQRWKQWQDFHMNTRGWVDIAYTGGVCNHGYAFAGRGVGVRTAANGTNTGNYSFYAITWIGGEGEVPSRAALDAFEWWVLELRKAGAGKQVRPHRYFKSTACPGTHLVTHAANLHNKNVAVAPPAPAPTPTERTTKRMIIRFEGDNHVWEVVGSELYHITADAFKARGLTHGDVKVLPADHPLANLGQKFTD